jgi:protocatechuate 3,4-dioxygenase beta subunit
MMLPSRSRLAIATSALALTGALVLAQQAPPPPVPPVPAVPQPQGRGTPPVPQQGRGQQPTRDNLAAPAVGTGTITGTVTTEGSGTPVRRARVTLSGPELRGGRTSVANDEGHFAFTALPPGRFTMTASKAGYVDIAYGAKRPGRPGTPIQLAEAQKLEKANITMPRGSVVTGVVIDENGEPSPGTSVRVMRFVMRTGERTLQQAGQDQTDDRGIYRIYGLQPGAYIVSASPRNMNIGDLRQTILAEIEAVMQQAQAARGGGPGAGGGPGGGAAGGRGAGRGAAAIDVGQFMSGRGQNLIDRASELQQQLQQAEQEQATAYAPVYYPGTTAASAAAPVTLSVGEERGGVDFQLQLVPTAKIEGRIVGPDGNPVQETRLSLVPSDNAGMPPIPGVSSNMARVDREGKFSFTNVTPGQYRVMARAAVRPAADPNSPATQGPGRGGRGEMGPGGRGGQPQQVLWASADITVGGQNISDLVLNLQPGMTMTGRVTFEGSALPPPTDLTRVRVALNPRGQQQGFEMGGVPPGQVDAGGRFTITGVVPGRYTISANAPPNAGGGGRAGAAGAPNFSSQPTAQWVVKSVVAGGRDVLDFPLVVEPNQDVGGAIVTFGDRSQEVSGTIQDTQGKPTADYTIIIYPSDNRYWQPQSRRILSVRPGTDGRFTFRTLPPGDYRITAVTDVEPGEWFNPDFLTQLVSASIPLTLTEGEKKAQDIRVK